MSPTNKRVLEIAERLRGYCANHPSAADSLEGVRRWWLGTSMSDTLADEVEDALVLLAGEAAIERRTLGDGTVLYVSTGKGAPS